MSDFKSQLITNPSVSDMASIESPQMKVVVTTIKEIQKRLKDSDIKNLEFSRAYDILSNEFNDFFLKYTSIFIKVIRGEDLATVAAVIFYKDKVLSGKLSETDVMNMTMAKFLPENLQADAKKKMAEMHMQSNNE